MVANCKLIKLFGVDMKKLIIILFFISSAIFAQNHSGAIKLGYFNPGAADGGFIVGYESGHTVDRNLIIGWSIDWFNKNFTDQSLVSEFELFDPNIGGEINELRAKTNLHSIPIMFNLTGKFPLAPKMSLYLSGSLGAEVLLIFYRNYENPNDDDFQGAFDFSWRLGIGTAYQLGHRSEFLLEVAYHNSEPSWTYEVEDRASGRKRTFERVFDMSGVMARAGFRFYFR
jgi:hypothetical protein